MPPITTLAVICLLLFLNSNQITFVVQLKLSYVFPSFRTLIKTIMCGQILSLTLCGVGTTSAALAKWYNVRIPGFQAFLTYSVLALTAGTKLAFDSGRFREVIKKRGWKYILLGVVDVEANFLLVKAYTFTTLTSAQVCGSSYFSHFPYRKAFPQCYYILFVLDFRGLYCTL